MFEIFLKPSTFKFGFILLFYLYSTTLIYSQVSELGIPESFSLGQKKNIIPRKVLNTISIEGFLKEDADKGIPNRYAAVQDLEITIRDSSLKTEIPGKGYIWQYQLQTEKALSIGVLFKTFHLPEGARVFIYTPDHSQVLGAFTSYNNNTRRMLAIADLKENTAIIEYFEPYSVDFPGELVLGPVSLAYRDITTLFESDLEVGINCPEGDHWQEEKRSVARMTFRDTDGAYYCTGFLVNTVRQDLKPYFMTASHCISSDYSAYTLLTIFNYENIDCSISGATWDQTISGSALIANSDFSDFSLLLLDATPPKDYNPYFAGWDASGKPAESGAGIHHPMGKPKCISSSFDPFVMYDSTLYWSAGSKNDPNTHWQVKFTSGRTEPGSSGSPVFNEDHRVVGQLAGGNDYYEYYGAFHVSWNHEVNNIRQLKHWLDPDNTGTLAVDGKRLNREPVAKFSIDHSSVSHSKVCVNDVNVLTDESYNMPVSWQWNISPSNFDFMNGTGMTSRNPQVKFNAKGYYTVKLRVSNAYGEDSIIKTDFIDAVSSITTSFINPPALSKICGSELNKIPLTAGGANEYIFSCSKSNRVNIESANAYAVLSLNEENKKFGAFTSLLRVDGSVGSCKSFATIPLNVTIPGNDDFRDALLIFPGATNSFDNTCATGEFTEPYPSTFDCTSDHSWCPGTMVNGILNSIWFQFYGPPDGKVSIITSGKNNRIAVYEANIKSDDYSFSNDGITYSIVGSNDNTSFTNKAASLENLKVIPGKKYWLQIESYDVDVGPIDLSIQGKKDIEVYPNPGSGLINLIIPTSDPAIANVNIFSLSGRLVYSNDNSGIASSNPFEIDLSGSPAGMYYIQVKLDNSTYSKKILIVK